MDPRKVNGGVFLGLNGVVIKSHGGTDAEGFASAIDLAREMAKNDLMRMIADDLALGGGAVRRMAAAPRRAIAARRHGMIRSVVRGIGSYLPAKVLTNADLATMVDTSDEWIVQRTGIRERRHRGGRRTHLRPCDQGGAKGAGRAPGSRRRRST